MAGIINSAWTKDQARQGFADAKNLGWSDQQIADYAKSNNISSEMLADAAYAYGDASGGSRGGVSSAFNALQAYDPTGKQTHDIAAKYGVGDQQVSQAIADAGLSGWDTKRINDYSVEQGFRAPTQIPPKVQTAQTQNINFALPTMEQVSSYTPTMLGKPERWEITPEQTVAGQLKAINDPNSPLIQQARTQALKESAARGLINSSMSVTAGEDAAYRASLPIAQQDAETYSRAAGYNVETPNQFAVRNAEFANRAGEFNAGARNQFLGQQLGSATQLATTGMDIQSREKLAALSNELQKYGIDISAATSRYGTDVGAQTSRDNARLAAETSRYGTDVGAATTREGQATSERISTSQQQTSKEIAAMNAQTSRDIAALNAQASAGNAAAARESAQMQFNAQLAFNKSQLNNQQFNTYTALAFDVMNREYPTVGDRQKAFDLLHTLYPNTKPISFSTTPTDTPTTTTTEQPAATETPAGQITVTGPDGKPVTGTLVTASDGTQAVKVGDDYYEVVPQ